MQSTTALSAVFPFVFLNRHSDALKSAFRYVILYIVYNDIPCFQNLYLNVIANVYISSVCCILIFKHVHESFCK